MNSIPAVKSISNEHKEIMQQLTSKKGICRPKTQAEHNLAASAVDLTLMYPHVVSLLSTNSETGEQNDI